MSIREAVFLGTASQVPTRTRNHNAVFLFWDDLGILFDPGEGTQRQMTLAGIAAMRARRTMQDVRLRCAGPGRLCQALAITRAHDSLPLDKPPFRLLARPNKVDIAVGRRIGITKAAEKPWRYGLAGSRFVSKPFPDQ